MDARHTLMHQVMLGDRIRLEAFEKALAEVVRPGAVVADIGAGLLPLTALALRCGAARVYAVEADPATAAMAEKVIDASGWGDRVTLVAGDARRVRLPEPVDVLVGELIGNLGPEEDVARLLRSSARRMLKPGGQVVPARVTTHLAPVNLGDEGWGVWRDGFLDMRLDVVQNYAETAAQLHFFTQPPTVLGEPGVLADSSWTSTRPLSELTLTIAEPGELQAIAGYFEATLVPGVTLSNFPSYPGSNWAVWIWPLRHTVVTAGRRVRLRLHSAGGSRVVTDWRLDAQLLPKENS